MMLETFIKIFTNLRTDKNRKGTAIPQPLPLEEIEINIRAEGLVDVID